MRVFAGWIVWNDRQSAAVGEKLSKSLAVVGGVGGANGGWRQGFDEPFGGADVAELPWCDLKSYRSAVAIDDSVDFRRAAAARAANRLILRPPFPPAALR